MMPYAVGGLLLFALLAVGPAPLLAHDGPPFPIVSESAAGPYVISVWTDPDTTADGSEGGQFWVMMGTAGEGAVPRGTRAVVTAAPLDREGPERTAAAEPVGGDPATQFAALVLDHEGRFRIQVAVDGPLGNAMVASEVEATYDLRPPPVMLVLYLAPFLLVGLLWTKLLLQRRKVLRETS